MNPSKDSLDKKLFELEQISKVAEHEIYDRLRELRLASGNEDPCREWNYEMLAFSFLDNFSDENPYSHYVDLQGIDEDTIAYWYQRAQTTQNPLLKERYSSLVWHLSESIIKKRPHHSAAIMCCEATFQIVENRSYKYEVNFIQKLKHALDIALRLNNPQLIEKATKTIQSYEETIAEDSKPGLWGFSFDLLVVNRRVNLPKDEERAIVETLEARLKRLADNGDHWDCERAAERLASYYRRKGQDDESKRVIRVLGNTFKEAANNSDPLLASMSLEHIYLIYSEYGLNEDAEIVAVMLRELGPRIRDGMEKIHETLEIPRDEVEAFIDYMLKGQSNEVFIKIVREFIPKRNEIEINLREYAKESPLSFIIPRQISDNQGRHVATVGSIENDLEGHVVTHMAQLMAISKGFLSEVLKQAIEKFGLDHRALIMYMLQSPVFIGVQKELLARGIEAYLGQDYAAAIHFIIPQIEAAIRYLVESFGGSVLEQRRGGGFHLMALDKLLRTEQVIGTLGEDISLYLRVLLTDQRGWNVRNDVSHGIMPYEHFSKVVADRLIHVLLILAQIRGQES